MLTSQQVSSEDDCLLMSTKTFTDFCACLLMSTRLSTAVYQDIYCCLSTAVYQGVDVYCCVLGCLLSVNYCLPGC